MLIPLLNLVYNLCHSRRNSPSKALSWRLLVYSAEHESALWSRCDQPRNHCRQPPTIVFWGSQPLSNSKVSSYSCFSPKSTEWETALLFLIRPTILTVEFNLLQAITLLSHEPSYALFSSIFKSSSQYALRILIWQRRSLGHWSRFLSRFVP